MREVSIEFAASVSVDSSSTFSRAMKLGPCCLLENNTVWILVCGNTMCVFLPARDKSDYLHSLKLSSWPPPPQCVNVIHAALLMVSVTQSTDSVPVYLIPTAGPVICAHQASGTSPTAFAAIATTTPQHVTAGLESVSNAKTLQWDLTVRGKTSLVTPPPPTFIRLLAFPKSPFNVHTTAMT